ncbi:hypothetical protein Tco_1326733 [Tanacetum coccineum]
MEELLRAPTKGYGEAIFLPELNADHFEIKTNLLQLVQANPFYGRESENPHAHINSFKRITSTLRFKNVPNDVIKLMMFPYSLKGAAKTWYEKEPPNSILTWEDLGYQNCREFVSKKVVTPAPFKAVEETCVTCGGAQSWYNVRHTDKIQACVYATLELTIKKLLEFDKIAIVRELLGVAPQKSSQSSGDPEKVSFHVISREWLYATPCRSWSGINLCPFYWTKLSLRNFTNSDDFWLSDHPFGGDGRALIDVDGDEMDPYGLLMKPSLLTLVKPRDKFLYI